MGKFKVTYKGDGEDKERTFTITLEVKNCGAVEGLAKQLKSRCTFADGIIFVEQLEPTLKF
ncbi:hypothetical protein M1316_00465 [Candidatus Parvarchaeota archaeon]|nr:hypothetical protein [Candidatus Parvarchaeota archaeon]